MKKSKPLIYVTKAEAARRLTVSRPTLDRLLARQGAPSPTAAKRYSLDDLTRFIAAQGESSVDTLRSARLVEVQLRCEKLRRELDRDAGVTILRSAVDDLHGRLAAGVRSMLYDGLENRLPAACAGYDALALRRYGRSLADEIVGRLAGDIDTWNPSST
jgi:hypothetical protein